MLDDIFFVRISRHDLCHRFFLPRASGRGRRCDGGLRRAAPCTPFRPSSRTPPRPPEAFCQLCASGCRGTAGGLGLPRRMVLDAIFFVRISRHDLCPLLDAIFFVRISRHDLCPLVRRHLLCPLFAT